MIIPNDAAFVSNLVGSASDKLDNNPLTFAFDVTPVFGLDEAAVQPAVTLGTGIFDNGVPNRERIGAEDRAQLKEAVQLWDDLVDVGFSETTSRSADITINMASDFKKASAQGWTYSSVDAPGVPDDSDVFIKNLPISQLSANDPRFRFFVSVHELGHALGLRHPNGEALSDPFQDYSSKAFNNDSFLVSVMSYFDPDKSDPTITWKDTTFAAQTPMIYDILAIQKKYGADFNTRSTATTYGFNSNAGRDVFDFNKNTAPVLTIWDGGGFDTLDVSDFFTNQRIDLHQGGVSSIGPLNKNVAIAYFTDIEAAIGGHGNDVILGNRWNNSLVGGEGNDSLVGEDGNDTLRGGEGKDNLRGQLGDDKMFGGTEGDNLFGHEGDDVLDGEQGDDFLFGGQGNDTLLGGKGNNELHGGEGDDTLFSQNGGNSVMWGDEGTNEILGANGNDEFISVAGGINRVNGGSGDDTYVLGDGADTIEDGNGFDTIQLTHGSSLNWVQGIFTGDVSNDVFAPESFDQYIGSNEADSFILPVTQRNRVDLRGGGGGDVLAGARGRDQIWGDAGNDLLRGNGGNDALEGGAGRDTAYFDDHFGDLTGGWNINLDGGTATTRSQGTRLVAFSTETDTLKSIENVIASNGNDRVTGNASNNDMDGLRGVDTISFADHFGSRQKGWDIDMIAGKARTQTELTAPRIGSVIRTETDTFKNFENLIGSEGNDTIQSAEGRIAPAILVPLSIPTVDGGGGKDTLKLAPGIFDVTALDNNTSAANDVVVFSAAGAGSVETATTILGTGTTPLTSGLRAATGHLNFKNIEVLDTGTGQDSVTGSSGADQAILGDGDDTASMGAGDDIVTGGAGADRLTGGAGKDQFRYTKVTDGGDTIVDFRLGDEIAFASAGFNNLKKGALLASNFVANAAGTASQADDYFVFNTNDHSLWFDADGSGAGAAIKIADFSNNSNVTAADVVLI